MNGDRDDTIVVPSTFATHRFWRNTSIASLQPGQTAALIPGTLGYEWDEDLDNGFRPPGLTRLSSTTVVITVADTSTCWITARRTGQARLPTA